MQPLSRNRLGRFLLRGENGCDTPPHNFCIKLVWWYSAPHMTEATIAEERADTGDEETSRIYEIGYHIVPTKKEDELEGVVATIRSIIEKLGGKFLAEGAPSLTRLAYTMTAQSGGKGAEHDRGYFGWIKFEAPVSAALQLDRALSASQEIMRSVLFQTVREETRARFKTATIREVKRSDVLRAAPRAEEVSAPVSEEDLDKAISEITSD